MASTDVLVHINMNGNEIQNVLAQKLASAPSNPSSGQFYYNTVDNILYVYNGTSWVNTMSQGAIYTGGNGIDINGSNVVSIDIASGSSAGNVTLTADTNGLSASAPTASTSTAGLIEIATDTEASTGTDTTRAINAKQLATKVTANTAITGATKCKITYDSKGLVTSGADLSASDIPNITLSKISDVTATASEVNVLDGITASTTELNYVDGVTSNIQTQLDGKIGLTGLSIDNGSTNYLGYDNTTGKFSAKVDTTVTGSSSKLITSGAVKTAIDNALTGALVYQGSWTATGQTDYSSITLPVKKGYMYIVVGSATIGGIEWNAGDYLVINKDIASGGTITSSDIEKIDNTESSDIVRLNATQTLTNKTIDADDNTISDLTTSNFKSGTIVNSVGSTGSDTSIPTEKAVRSAISTAISNVAHSFFFTNPALTSSGGVCTWTISNSTLAALKINIPYYDVTVYDISVTPYKKIVCDITEDSSMNLYIKINSSSDIAASTYEAKVVS